MIRNAMLGIVALCSMFFACSRSDSGSASPEVNKGSLQVALKYSESVRFDSLVVHGEGADTVHFNLNANETALDLELFPSLWKFYGKLYAGGVLMQKGEAEVEVKSGERSYLQLSLLALFGFVDVKIPLGLGNPAGVASGELTLTGIDSTYRYKLQIEEPYGYFSSGALPLNAWYAVSLELLDKNGDLIYRADDSLYLDQENASVNWALTSLKGSLSLGISTQKFDTLDVNVGYLSRNRRTPRKGDVLISEFFAIPPQSGTGFEFVEFYNATLDTIVLDDCLIGLKSTSSNSAIPENTVILPGQYLTVGGDSTEFLHLPSWFGLTNTKANLILTCDGVVLDSIAYSISADAASDSVQIKSSSSTHLDLGYWDMRDKGFAWCLGEPSPNYASSCDADPFQDGEDDDFTE